MPVVKFDVSGTDPEKATQDFQQPKPGVYKAKVHEINMGFSKDDKTGKPDKTRPRMEVIYEIQDKKYKGSRIWDYVSFSEAAEWKLDQFLQAFGIANKRKRTGSFKTESIVGEMCKLRLKADKNQEGEYRAKAAATLAWTDDEDEEEEDFDDEETEDVEDEDEDDEEAEDDEDGEDEETEEEDDEVEVRYYDQEELGGMELATLKEVVEDLELEPPATVLKSKVKLSKWIFENQPGEAPEEEEEEEAEDDEEEEGDGYDELSVTELKEECKERGLKAVGSKDALIAKLRKADADGPF